MDSLSDYQTRIRLRFQELAEQRPNSPVFLLEHGLARDNLDNIRKLIISEHINCDDILRNYHSVLLVLLTETGYDYEGSGTNFWEKFAKTLNWKNVNNEQRNQIRDLFYNRETVWHIAKPLKTNKWALRFNIIAHPIANAVLPRDVRVPLMESLQLLFHSASKDKEKIHSFLETYKPDSFTIRYENWIKSFPFVNELVSAFISPCDTSSFLSVETFNRIKQDLENDKHLSATLRDIRRRYKTPSVVSITHNPKQKAIPPLRLYLRKDTNGQFRIVGKLPEQHTKMLWNDNHFKQSLRAGNWQPKAWNAFPLKPAAFLQSEQFDIPVHYLDKISKDIPFVELPDDCSKESKQLLESLRFDLSVPAVFHSIEENLYRQGAKKVTEDSGIAVCIIRNKIDITDGVDIENISNGYYVYSIDTAKQSALDWAGNCGIEVTEKQRYSWLVPFGEKSENTIYLHYGDSFYLFIHNEQPLEVKTNNQMLETTGLIAFDDLATGKHMIEINNDIWEIYVAEKTTTLPLFNVELQGEPIVESLRNRTLTLEIDSPQCFVNVDYTISLFNKDGMQVVYTDKIETFPSRLYLFRQAFNEKQSDGKSRFWTLIRCQQDLTLRLEIAGIFKQEWTLESISSGIWWTATDTDNPVPETDGSNVFAEEILHKRERYPLYSDDLHLFRAAQNNEPLYRAATILKCPDTYTLNNQLQLPKRKLRQLSDTDNGIGLENIVEDILAFRQLQADSFLSELYRRRTLDELEKLFWTLTCGESFAEQMNEAVYGRQLTDLIYPAKTGDMLFRQFQDNNSLDSAVKQLENVQKSLTGNPYRSLWNTNVIRNMLAMFFNPSAFEFQFKPETLRAMLLDRQTMRCAAFLCWRKRQSERIQEVFNDV